MFDLIAAAVIAMAPGHVAYEDMAPTVNCHFEDGRPDGQDCIWVDPDTGTQYWVDSSNYR
jgi:hypothetical protein